MANYLNLVYKETENQTLSTDNYENRNKPFAKGPVYNAFIESFQTLAQGSDVKTIYHLKLSIKDATFDFMPGDVIAILPENDEKEVMELLIRLTLEKVCHKECCLEIMKGTTKKNAIISNHLPKYSTLYNIFLRHLDIRTSPKKMFLKSLIKFTKDASERKRLEFICSPSGSEDYIKLLTVNRRLLSLLNEFPSCSPPVELILEHSSPLNPRYFSIASSPFNKNLSIIFCVMKLDNGLKGICTGWLERIIKDHEFKLKSIPIYFRIPGNFRLKNLTVPNILVATGTGLAPFMSFLEYKKIESSKSVSSEMWLFYGCRYANKDFLCQEKLQSYCNEGVLTQLNTAFSREGAEKEYVQHKIAQRKEKLIELILNEEGIVFVCGDFKTVVRDVKESIIKCFMDCKNIDRTSAEDIFNDLIKCGRFLVDSWM